jgi:hypothetical protein
MSHSSYSIDPLPTPLHRLNVRDNLIINADRWLTSERYQRDRQNLQFQAVNQPGIVCGLGVKLLDDQDLPEPIQAHTNYIWIEIQPGVAIDPCGNPIVVAPNTPRLNRIFSIDPKLLIGRDRVTIYVTLSYVEPKQPSRSTDEEQQETLPEQFRVDRLPNLPTAEQIELCRIELTQGGNPRLPQEVLSPCPHELNLCHRPQAQARSQGLIRAAQIRFSEELSLSLSKDYEHYREDLAELMSAVFSLYPALEGDPNVEVVDLSERHWKTTPLDFDLLHIPDLQDLFDSKNEPRYMDKCSILASYLEAGGTILLEVEALMEVKDFLRQIQPKSRAWENPTPEPSSQEESPILPKVNPLSDPKHLLRRKPFLFSALPRAVQLYHQSGIVVIEGNLSQAWNVNSLEQAHSDRADIRAAQELGINILHFAWQRRRLTQLMQW